MRSMSSKHTHEPVVVASKLSMQASQSSRSGTQGINQYLNTGGRSLKTLRRALTWIGSSSAFTATSSGAERFQSLSPVSIPVSHPQSRIPVSHPQSLSSVSIPVSIPVSHSQSPIPSLPSPVSIPSLQSPLGIQDSYLASLFDTALALAFRACSVGELQYRSPSSSVQRPVFRAPTRSRPRSA